MNVEFGLTAVIRNLDGSAPAAQTPATSAMRSKSPLQSRDRYMPKKGANGPLSTFVITAANGQDELFD